MKFIFPQNYKFNNKIFGIFDYGTAIANVIWYILVYFILNIIVKKLQIKIFLFILFCFPFFLISMVGINQENIILIFKYLIKYLRSKKIYIYK